MHLKLVLGCGVDYSYDKNLKKEKFRRSLNVLRKASQKMLNRILLKDSLSLDEWKVWMPVPCKIHILSLFRLCLVPTCEIVNFLDKGNLNKESKYWKKSCGTQTSFFLSYYLFI